MEKLIDMAQKALCPSRERLLQVAREYKLDPKWYWTMGRLKAEITKARHPYG